MASTASSSTLPATPTSTRQVTGESEPPRMEQRPQAGPLPLKTPRLVGEIGYSESGADVGDGSDDDTDSTEGLNAAEVDARNGRHPAERSQVNLTSPPTTVLPIRSVSTGRVPLPNESTSSLNTTSKHSIFSLHSLSSRLSAKTPGGFTVRTITRLSLLILLLTGLVTAWAFAAQHFAKTPVPQNTQSGGTSAIFIHVAFAILSLVILIFIERAVFQLRAERYAHLHPGEILPSHRHCIRMHPSNAESAGMAFAPWNRPPLPTYAAALGVRGTGDVEDAIIAAPPPPAYGNTRGSTLLLASLLRNSRLSGRSSRTSAPRSEEPWQMVSRADASARVSGVSTRSLPISYGETEHQDDAERARVLEEALAKLEDGISRS
ncbi:hypothetical protein K439DRAFT_215613 [Ramaria rubella]|nr:hypothetical protein K439DRAFT_215613 [Ramaria rubella]